MKLNVERSALLKALGTAAAIVERKNTIPILSNLLIETIDNETARVVATDLDMQVAIRFPAQVEEAGGVTLPAMLVHSVVRESTEGCQIELSHAKGESRAQLVSGRSRTRLAMLPADDFPALAMKDQKCAFELPGAGLAEALRICAPSISTEVTRWYLNGIVVELEDEHICFASTDGHRLAAYRLDKPEDAEGCHGSILPRKLVAELAKLLTEVETPIALAFAEGKVRIATGDVEIVSKVIDGTYPDWRRTVPNAEGRAELKADREGFAGAVRRAALVSGGKDRIIAIELVADKLTASSRGLDTGESEEELPAAWAGPDLRIGFNSRYLTDMFAVMAGEQVAVAIDGPTGPVLIRDAALPNATFVLMPCRT